MERLDLIIDVVYTIFPPVVNTHSLTPPAYSAGSCTCLWSTTNDSLGGMHEAAGDMPETGMPSNKGSEYEKLAGIDALLARFVLLW